MIDLPKPGAYVVRAPNAKSFSQGLVQYWLNSQEETPFKACLWLTASPHKEVRSLLEPYLRKRSKALKGLDVVSVKNLPGKTGSQNGVRQLCRSMDSLCVLQPALVVLEHADMWFDHGDELLHERNPMSQMRLLNQWALHAQAHVVTPVQGDLPDWGVFADGLADVTDQGDFEFRPWWPTQWGLQTNLWTDNALLPQLKIHHVLDSQTFSGLNELAQACHSLRFGNNEMEGIHVQAHGDISRQEASVLLRMGADSVWLQQESIENWLGFSSEKITKTRPQELPRGSHSANFARDLHEVFMPGLLTVIPNPTFAVHGLMMMQLAKRWSVSCTMTRLSLMRHMTAQTALRLANWSQATCMFTATREAIYVLKLWAVEPDETTYRAWLESCFRENIAVLFSGDIQFLGEQTQADLLSDLYKELEPLSVEDLMGHDFNEPAKLAELWNDAPEALSNDRPWTKRMGQLLRGVPS
ncbi:hypothetical protein [Limnobacter parvus]|uniref:Uncharacterized protein n=1 Tax=Limnobacter parvus TaxID=2939690 RepID=A0ABT1XJS4_9BURK|nr:hypothetical protein [Limnobacter parvus]MCR2747106.1 hypothetical protein [Limnobacter parvus]